MYLKIFMNGQYFLVRIFELTSLLDAVVREAAIFSGTVEYVEEMRKDLGHLYESQNICKDNHHIIQYITSARKRNKYQ